MKRLMISCASVLLLVPGIAFADSPADANFVRIWSAGHTNGGLGSDFNYLCHGDSKTKKLHGGTTKDCAVEVSLYRPKNGGYRGTYKRNDKCSGNQFLRLKVTTDSGIGMFITESCQTN